MIKKQSLVGVDEAGRGAWAGPIVAAAVFFNKPLQHKYLKDSKLLSTKQREELYKLLQAYCDITIATVSPSYIDNNGLQKANVLVMEKAIKKINKRQPIVLDYVGGFKKITVLKSLYSLHKRGESKFKEIAAASIIAKVHRDWLMKKYHKKYPNYGFNRHKGYGTKQHQQALSSHGLCLIHRRSFKITTRN